MYGCETWSLKLRDEHSLGVFENRVLRKIFGPKRDKVTGELNDLYSSPNIIQVIKSRTMRWVGHVVCMGRGKVHTGLWWGNLREADHLEDPGIDQRTVWKWIYQAVGRGTGTGLIWFRIGMVTGCCECLWVPENVGNFLTSCKLVSFSRSNLPMELVTPGQYQVTSFHVTQPEVCTNLSSLLCMLHVTYSLRFLTLSSSHIWWRVHNTKLLTMQFSAVLTFPPS